jgi:hypothetical protein
MLLASCVGDTTPPMMEDVRTACPMIVEGAQVEAEEITDGAALVFTTESGDVADLVRRTEAMSAMYRRRSGGGRIMWHHVGERGPHHRPGRVLGDMPAARSRVEPIERGARILLTPVEPTDVAAIREHVRAHRERFASGECWLDRS